jgi:NADH dehydrogenase (ubiquinone) Fe-S protein 1
VNTEGRTQVGRAAVPPPGAAREDWKIIRALSEVVEAPLPYDDVLTLRDRMWDISPTLVRYDLAEKTSLGVAQVGLNLFAQNKETGKGGAFGKVVKNFYQTDVVSRA